MRFELAANETKPVQVHAGTLVRCLRGQLWITREKDAQDYIVREGMSFRTDAKGLMVIASLDAASTVVVSNATDASVATGVYTDGEEMQRLANKAHRMQAVELRRVWGSGLAWVTRLVAKAGA